MPFRQSRLLTLAALTPALLLAACGGGTTHTVAAPPASSSADATTHDMDGVPNQAIGSPAPAASAADQAVDIYQYTKAGMMSPAVANDIPLVYVPNLQDGTVSVIDPATYKVIRTIKVGLEPQHVVPSWDLKTLWVNNNRDSLTPIDPTTGMRGGADIPVVDPYNLYFTPDGTSAMVMAEANTDIDFRDPHTFVLQSRLHLGDACMGVNHADFAADGSYMIASCEFSGRVVKIDLKSRTLVGYLSLGPNTSPQDVKVDPYGKIFYVADMNSGGLHEIDGDSFTKVGFLPTGPEAHGLYPSRDGTVMYVANRGGQQVGAFGHQGDNGSVSVVDFKTRTVIHQWPIPHSTPDMGNVSADGKVFWVSGRRSNEVYAISTDDGHLIARIPVGKEPHGLAVWPLPGRYSLGHTGILR